MAGCVKPGTRLLHVRASYSMGCSIGVPLLLCAAAVWRTSSAPFGLRGSIIYLTAVRAGGHSVAGNSICDGGLMIDVSPMNGVTVDRTRRIARVQGGAIGTTSIAKPRPLASQRREAWSPIRVSPALTLNGGIGWLRNRYGLTCDNLTSAEVVTADGEVLTANADENADLFWSLRGGGGNFGVATSFEFALHPVGPLVATVFSFYPIAATRDVLKRWREWVGPLRTRRARRS